LKILSYILGLNELKIPCVVEQKVVGGNLEGSDTVQLGVTSTCSISLLAAPHTYPGFTDLERETSSPNCKAGKMSGMHNDIS